MQECSNHGASGGLLIADRAMERQMLFFVYGKTNEFQLNTPAPVHCLE